MVTKNPGPSRFFELGLNGSGLGLMSFDKMSPGTHHITVKDGVFCLFVCFELVREEGYKQKRFFSELNNILFKFKYIPRTSGKPLMNPSAFAC